MSTSSTFEGGSSPVLPPLPAPTFNGRTLDTIKTPPRVESSSYYTASWGSPYETTAPSLRTPAHRAALSSDPSEDSPLRHLEFHTPFLRPAPTFTRSQTDPDFVSHDGLISAAVLANRARRPAQGLTEDWIRQHIGGESAEANNWLSDDPGDSEHSSLSGSISGDWLEQEADPRTPTLKRFLDTREKGEKGRDVFAPRRHSTATLKQADFSDSFQPNMSTADGNAVVDPVMGNENSTQAEEQGPAVPPKELPEWRAASLPAQSLPKPTAPVASVSPAPGPPRLKKKVPWKGKNIMVLLPWDDERGQKSKAPTPLSDKDMEIILAEWEQQGYNTTGFNLGHEIVDEEAGQGQSRSIWPQANVVEQEWQQREFRVSIPDRKGERDFLTSHVSLRLDILLVPSIPSLHFLCSEK